MASKDEMALKRVSGPCNTVWDYSRVWYMAPAL